MDDNVVQLRGTIVSVAKRSFNTELVGSHSSGSSTLTVDEAFNFNPDGGTLAVGGETYTYTSVDDDTGVIALSGVTSESYDDGDEVGIRPARNEKIATVVIDGSDSAIQARIIHVLEPFLLEGVRDPGEQEYALLMYDGEEYLVFDAPGKVPAIDASAITPATETIFIDGPPDFYSDGSQWGEGPYLTYAEMAAVADPAWVTIMDGVTADNGTIVLNSADPGTLTNWDYYPVWMVPNNGRSWRVAMDDVTFGGTSGGVDVDNVTIGASLQNDTGTFDVRFAYVDNFEITVTDYATSTCSEKRWTEYQAVYPGEFVGDIQNPPLQSVTPTEDVGMVEPEDLSLPQTAVCLSGPFYNYPFGWTTSHVITISGLRVELL